MAHRSSAGRLCPICVRPTAAGTCRAHGPWQPHQLLTRADRRHTARARAWQPFEPLVHACPRCLGDVVEGRAGFDCVPGGHTHERHGPYRVDELLGPTAQRESAAHRARLARRERARRDARGIQAPAIPWPAAARTARLLAGAVVIAATFAFLGR